MAPDAAYQLLLRDHDRDVLERAGPIPHFHAAYSGHEASIALGGDVLGGSLPPRTLRLVRAWASQHEDELMRNWLRARQGEALDSVDPLP
jgi:hypothetical protein